MSAGLLLSSKVAKGEFIFIGFDCNSDSQYGEHSKCLRNIASCPIGNEYSSPKPYSTQPPPLASSLPLQLFNAVTHQSRPTL